MTVHLIAACGHRGQIGRAGDLPWRGNPDIEAAMAADLAAFRRLTMGGVVILGRRTARGMPRLDGRCVYEWAGSEAAEVIETCGQEWPGRPIWIAGGAHTYRTFAPFVDGLKLISAIPYDSPAEEDREHVFFPFDAYGIRWGGAA